MDRSIRERFLEGIVDQAVLLDEREPGEPGARDRHLEVVAPARPVDDRELGRVRERTAKKLLQAVGHGPDDSAPARRLGRGSRALARGRASLRLDVGVHVVRAADALLGCGALSPRLLGLLLRERLALLGAARLDLRLTPQLGRLDALTSSRRSRARRLARNATAATMSTPTMIRRMVHQSMSASFQASQPDRHGTARAASSRRAGPGGEAPL